MTLKPSHPATRLMKLQATTYHQDHLLPARIMHAYNSFSFYSHLQGMALYQCVFRGEVPKIERSPRQGDDLPSPARHLGQGPGKVRTPTSIRNILARCRGQGCIQASGRGRPSTLQSRSSHDGTALHRQHRARLPSEEGALPEVIYGL